MKKPMLEVIEKKNGSQEKILIVDKGEFIGEKLNEKITKDFSDWQVFFFQLGKKIPAIPDLVYSTIFFISHEKNVISEFLPLFVQKAKKDGARLIIGLALKDYDVSFASDLASSYKNISLVIFGEILGEDYSFDQTSNANIILAQAKKAGKISLSNMGVYPTFPVFIDDLIEALIKAAFTRLKNFSIFFAFPKHPPTGLRIAHMLQKIEPTLKIDFNYEDGREVMDFVLPKEGEYILGDDYQLARKLRQVFTSDWTGPIVHNLKKQKQEGGENNNFVKQSFLFIAYALFVSVLFPIILTLVFSLAGLITFNSAKDNMERGDLAGLRSALTLSQNFFNLSKQTSAILTSEFGFFGKSDVIVPLVRRIDMGGEVARAAGYSLDGILDFRDVFSGKSSKPKEDYMRGLNNVKNAFSILQKIQTEGDITNFSIPVNLIESVMDVSPKLLGFDSARNYLILFQNNTELRPGGGFIGSYGLLTADKGKITDFLIHDVYDADGQLKGHVEPPFAIRRYLPQVHWYLRDSNFDVDFVKSASASAFLLNQETGKIVDGVIGVDLTFVQKLLAVLGPIKVLDYNETVNADNLFLLAEAHAEKDFFPGSSQKKQFLRSLFNAMQLNIQERKKIPYFALLETIGDAILEKHLLFAFSDASLQNLFTVNGMSSTLWDDRETNNSSINDFIGVSEANLGVNKVNYLVKRKVNYKVSLDKEGSASATLTIYYKNTSTKTSAFGGDYKNYLRLILPLSATLSEVIIDGKSQPLAPAVTDPLIYEDRNFTPPKELEVEQTEENGKTIYGLLIIIPPDTLKTINISYILPKTITSDISSFSYNLKLFKQPGTDSYPFTFSLSYPLSYNIVSNSPEIIKKEGIVSLSQYLLSDDEIFINFSKK